MVNKKNYLTTLSYLSYSVSVHLLRGFTFFNRRLREQSSIALKNISRNPDRACALSALSQAAVVKTRFQDGASCQSDSSGTFSSSEKNSQRPSTSHMSRTFSNGALLDGNASSKAQRTLSELTSLLTLVFQSDSLWKIGSERQFLRPNHLTERKFSRLKQLNSFGRKDKYLSSLRVLTNTLVLMTNLLLTSGSMDDKSDEVPVEVR